MKKYISAREAGKRWGFDGMTVSRWCHDGRVPGAIQATSQWLIPSNLSLEDVDVPKQGRPAKEKPQNGATG